LAIFLKLHTLKMFCKFYNNDPFVKYLFIWTFENSTKYGIKLNYMDFQLANLNARKNFHQNP